MTKNLLFDSFQITIADGQFVLQREQENERKLIFKFKTYGKQNIEQFEFCQVGH